jgi:hypothetical protein
MLVVQNATTNVNENKTLMSSSLKNNAMPFPCHRCRVRREEQKVEEFGGTLPSEHNSHLLE